MVTDATGSRGHWNPETCLRRLLSCSLLVSHIKTTSEQVHVSLREAYREAQRAGNSHADLRLALISVCNDDR